MIDTFNCPKCGVAPKASDNRARKEGVCDSCWTQAYMEVWYAADSQFCYQAKSRELVATSQSLICKSATVRLISRKLRTKSQEARASRIQQKN